MPSLGGSKLLEQVVALQATSGTGPTLVHRSECPTNLQDQRRQSVLCQLGTGLGDDGSRSVAAPQRGDNGQSGVAGAGRCFVAAHVERSDGQIDRASCWTGLSSGLGTCNITNFLIGFNFNERLIINALIETLRYFPYFSDFVFSLYLERQLGRF